PLPTATPLPTMTPTPVVITGCAAPAALPAVSGPTFFVAEAGINLREQPGLGCPVVVQIQQFTEMTALSDPVQADGLDWIMVEVAGFTGWVATDNIREPANG
ncbi:MAG: SH3 domain-containing protein, partial [Chloroflexota bacterium]|nr:SH3 domain-containing protein [Chloroflexota bacterium]